MKKVSIYFLMLFIALSFTSCQLIKTSFTKIGSKTGAKAVKRSLKEVAEESGEVFIMRDAREIAEEGAEKASKKATREVLEEGSEKVAQKTLTELASSGKTYKELYEHFSKYISKDFADGILVETTENGVRIFSKDFPNSFIRMNKSTIICNAGSLANSGPMNEFLNHLLPNMTYIVDDCFIYTTDKYGRVISAVADRSKGKLLKRNPQRNKDVQKKIIDMLDGYPGKDQGGHLFANNTGGPNELINQVPMNARLNMNGEWRRLEKIEETALSQGKNVTSQRKLLYRGKEKRPYAIEFTTIVDGEKTTSIVKNI